MTAPVFAQGGRVDRPGFRFAYPVRVAYADCDQQAVVFNAQYMTYLDIAVTEYFRFLDFDLTVMAKSGEFDVALARTTLEFKAPARFDDRLEVSVATRRMGNSSMTIAFGIFRAGEAEPLLLAETVYVNHDVHSRKSLRVPDVVRARVRQIDPDVAEA